MPRSEHASGNSFGTRAELRLVDGANLPSQERRPVRWHGRPTTPIAELAARRVTLRVGNSVTYGRRYVAREPTWVATAVGRGATATGATG
jgi:hypothetical protein